LLPHQPTNIRYRILVLLFVNVVINYMDRANISVAGASLSKEFNLSPVQLGLIFSAFGWTYVAFQIPGGFLTDCLKPRLLYFIILITWSTVTLLQGFVNGFAMLFGLRLATGTFEAPAYPTNNRVVTTWFPENERAFAIAAYTSGQYIGLATLTPLMATIQFYFGWKGLFIIAGISGIAWSLAWYALYRDPTDHQSIRQEELDHIKRGGGNIDRQVISRTTYLSNLKEVFSHRKLWGIYLGQYAINSSLWFFLTWFPIYLIKSRGLTLIETGWLASVPFVAAFAGILLSGFLSDYCIKKKISVTAARKTPVIAGLLLTVFIIGANYVESTSLIILFMCIAFFGNGMASISWVLVSLIAPKGMIGVTGGAFNFIGNLASMSVPFIIGFLVRENDFSSALIFISSLGIAGIASYIFLVGEIERVTIKKHEACSLSPPHLK